MMKGLENTLKCTCFDLVLGCLQTKDLLRLLLCCEVFAYPKMEAASSELRNFVPAGVSTWSLGLMGSRSLGCRLMGFSRRSRSGHAFCYREREREGLRFAVCSWG